MFFSRLWQNWNLRAAPWLKWHHICARIWSNVSRNPRYNFLFKSRNASSAVPHVRLITSQRTYATEEDLLSSLRPWLWSLFPGGVRQLWVNPAHPQLAGSQTVERAAGRAFLFSLLLFRGTHPPPPPPHPSRSTSTRWRRWTRVAVAVPDGQTETPAGLWPGVSTLYSLRYNRNTHLRLSPSPWGFELSMSLKPLHLHLNYSLEKWQQGYAPNLLINAI